jgi:hypothetical protein
MLLSTGNKKQLLSCTGGEIIMPNSNLTATQHASLVRNQMLFDDFISEYTSTTGLNVSFELFNPVVHPALWPMFTIDASLVQLVRGKNYGDSWDMKKALLIHMGSWKHSLSVGAKWGYDVRQCIADEILFTLWLEQMHSIGYRLLTENVAAQLHDNGTSIFLRSWLESYHSDDFNRSRKIRHAVRLVSPLPKFPDGHKHTSYRLEAAYSTHEYNFAILAASQFDTTAQGLWFFKPSSWK